MQYKKISRSFFCLICLLATAVIFQLPVSAEQTHYSGNAALHSMKGSGTELDPYRVETKDDLNSVRLYPDAHFLLVSNLVFSEADFAEDGEFYDYGTPPAVGISNVYGYGFEPIGSGAEPFSGSFDGNGHSITGFYTSIDTSYWLWIGLFGYTDGAVIKNLNLIDVNINATSNTDIETGAIAGYANDATISNCTVTGSITGDNHTGGIVGALEGTSVVSGCTNYATVTSIDSKYQSSPENPATEIIRAGGIVGTSSGTVIDCINEGNISTIIEGNSFSYAHSGGIVGELSHGTVSNSVNNGIISSKLSDTTNENERTPKLVSGGIVSISYGAVVKNSANNAAVYATGDDSCYAGGIVGYDEWQYNVANTDISNCSNAGDIIVNSLRDVAVGGIVGNLSGSITGSYNVGNISATTNSPDRDVYSEVGGVVGVSTGNISICYNGGDVTVNGSAADDYYRYFRTGGIAGRSFNGYGVTNCYNYGNITVNDGIGNNNNVYTAGLVGMMDRNTVRYGYNTGEITSSGRVGEAVGIIIGSSTFSEVYAYGGNRIIATADSGLTLSDFTSYSWNIADEESMREASSFVGFDFDSVWTMQGDTNYHYPEFIHFNLNEEAVLTGIEISSFPSQLIYALGNPLDITGGEIRLIYDDGTRINTPITSDMVSGFSTQTVGLKTLTVTYNNLTTNFSIDVMTKNEVLSLQLSGLIQTLPEGSSLSEEQRLLAKNIIAEAVLLMHKAGKDSIRNDSDLLSKIATLEQALLNAEPLITLSAKAPIIEGEIPSEEVLPSIPVEVTGLVLSAKGGGGSGSPMPIFGNVEYYLQVTQKNPSDEQTGIVIDVKPIEEIAPTPSSIPNFDLSTPVSFKLYLNSSFGGNIAYITHEISESDQYPITERLELPIYTDETGKFINITVTKFSTFIISDTPPPPTSVISGTIISSSPNFRTEITLYDSTDTEYSNPIETGTTSLSNSNSNELDFSVEAVYGTYDLVIRHETHLGYIVTGITLGESSINLNDVELIPGDANDDGAVNFLDLAHVRNSVNFNKSIYNTGADFLTDLNTDGEINVHDLYVILNGSYNSHGDTVVAYSE